ncbi:hypothetical protein DPMN_151652 [Dreissena polymorpha]|uniref:Uncharacterized protein n=1 Tax=Dreissena polymorpha TaxID=45954 RepID=A0A9D4FLM0_DREPO|nr:hypothetical protein DPMN_151652 [Dreissena polymorpha]
MGVVANAECLWCKQKSSLGQTFTHQPKYDFFPQLTARGECGPRGQCVRCRAVQETILGQGRVTFQRGLDTGPIAWETAWKIGLATRYLVQVDLYI